jgi:hypothetical protein
MQQLVWGKDERRKVATTAAASRCTGLGKGKTVYTEVQRLAAGPYPLNIRLHSLAHHE